jgi:hypothetical protein
LVLLRVIGDDVIDPRHILEIGLEDKDLGRLDGIDEGDPVAAAHEVGVVARAVGQRDEAVEQPAVEIRSADVKDIGNDLSGLHVGLSPREEQFRVIL